MLNNIAASQLEPPAACRALHRQWLGQAGRSPRRFEVGAVVRAHHEVHLPQDTLHRYHAALAQERLRPEGGRSGRRLAWEDASMSSDVAPDVSALAINVTIPEGLRWTGTRRG